MLIYNDEDFYIQIRPTLDKKLNWLGTVQVNIVTSNSNPIDDEGYNQIFHLCQLIAAIVPYMDKNPNIIEELEEIVAIESNKEKKLVQKVLDKTDNIVTLNFQTKTKGKA